MSDYKIISKTEDASKERVFYTIEIAPFRFVDVMCIRNTSENYEYLIQNEDASYVYYELEYKYTYPGYPFDERKCLNLAAAQYAKDYYAKESIWDEIRSDYYDDEQEAWAIDAWKNCDGDQGKVIAHVGDDKRITYYSEEAKIDPYAQEIIREVLLRIDEANTQKEKWVLALSKKMTKNVPEENKEYVKGFLFELFKKQPNNILNHFAYEYQVSADNFKREELKQKIMQKLHKDSEGLVSEILDLTFSGMIPEGLDDHVVATLQQLSDKELKRIAEKYQL